MVEFVPKDISSGPSIASETKQVDAVSQAQKEQRRKIKKHRI